MGSLGEGGVRGPQWGLCWGGQGSTTGKSQGLWSEEGRVLGLPPTGSVWATHRSFLGRGTTLGVKGGNRAPSWGCEDSVRQGLAWRKGLAHSVHFVPRVQPVRGSQTQFNEEG